MIRNIKQQNVKIIKRNKNHYNFEGINFKLKNCCKKKEKLMILFKKITINKISKRKN
jgi:hypothetical protein